MGQEGKRGVDSERGPSSAESKSVQKYNNLPAYKGSWYACSNLVGDTSDFSDGEGSINDASPENGQWNT